MANPFLSIIIPIYNVHDYLQRCVDSVVAECVGLSYEILLVDDGSTDGSGALCDEIAKREAAVTVLHKSNGGLSDARNYGVGHAKGEYVFYLDSDDYLVAGGLRAEIEAVVSTKCDVVCGNFYYSYSDHKTLFNTKPYNTFVVKGGEEALGMLVEGLYFQNFAWGKLIRRELAQKFLFPKGKLFEDTYWFHWILHEANLVTVIDRPVVHYVQRDGSISFEYKLKSLDILDGYTERLMFFEQNYPMLVNQQKYLMANNCISQAWMVCRYLKDDEKKNAIQKLRDTLVKCKLQENPLLEKSQEKKLWMIMESMVMYKWYYISGRLIEKICG